MISNFIGTLATIFGCVCYIPQIVKICKEKNADNISNCYLSLHMISNMLWITYSIMILSYPLIISGFLSSVQDILWIYYKYKKYNEYIILIM